MLKFLIFSEHFPTEFICISFLDQCSYKILITGFSFPVTGDSDSTPVRKSVRARKPTKRQMEYEESARDNRFMDDEKRIRLEER